MTHRKRLIGSVAAAGILICGAAMAGAAAAQTANPPTTPDQTPSAPANAGSQNSLHPAQSPSSTVSEVVVTGVRASLRSAQDIRKNSTDIVDSIVAEDIGKFPDHTVGDALQRITGVQIQRAAGEANTIVIRGLPNVVTEVDGRDIFTTTGRYVTLSDIPVELVSGLDVYKTLSPEQIEGGIAGTINIRLRKPFDFKGLEVAGSVSGIYGDQRNALDPNASGLISDRWQTSIGEMGALLSVSYQKRRYLDEQAFNFVTVPGVTNPANGQPLTAPLTTGDIDTLGDRTRYGVNFSAQWRPMNGLELYADSIYTGYRNNNSDSYFIGIPGAGTLQSYTLQPGTNEIETLNSANNFTLTSDQAYEDRTDTFQQAFGGKFTHGPLTVTNDLSYTYSIYRQRAVIVDTRFNAPSYSVDFNQNGSGTPNSTVGGVDITNASNFYLNQLFDDLARQTGSELAYRIDATYDLPIPLIRSIGVGFRYSYRGAGSQATNGNGIPDPAGAAGIIPAASLPGFGTLSPGDFLGGDRDQSITQWFTGSPQYLLSHTDTLRALFGQPAGEEPYDPVMTFHANQDAYAGYVKANYDFPVLEHRLSGDFGVRLVETDVGLHGFAFTTDAATGATATNPVNSQSDYFDVLPSYNGKLQLTDTTDLRLGVGKTVTYPDFATLNPSASLNTPGPTLIGTGSAGNPALQPIKSTNVDVALEWYFARTGSLTGTYFHRDIDGYIQTYSAFETIGGVQYLVSEPQNTGQGELQGLELGYQQFYDFLPWWFKGLGAQANFTYIDAHTASPPTNGVSVEQPLANVSRYSYNLVGIYERGPLSLRAAYNWRSKYVEAFNAGNVQTQDETIISKPYGDLAFSADYALTSQFELTFDAENLTRTVSQDYFTTTALPRNTNRSDRTFQIGLRFRM
jgi:iron complex outermembrane receptor protein